MKCKNIQKLLPDFVQGRSSDREAGMIRDHLSQCHTCLNEAQELAQQLNSQVCGVLCGVNVEALAETAIHNGADHVLLADHPELEHYRTLPYARITLRDKRVPGIFSARMTSLR